jgi:hypothetical protein
MLIHEFVTDETKDAKRARNDQDFRGFLHRLPGVFPDHHDVASGLAYYTVPGDPLFPTRSSEYSVPRQPHRHGGHVVSAATPSRSLPVTTWIKLKGVTRSR